MPRYRPVDPKVDLPSMERRILERWDAEGTFAASSSSLRAVVRIYQERRG